MLVTINKSTAKGSVFAPPSKSLAHRYIICAALAAGKSTITNVDFSEDIKATIDCVRVFGAEVEVCDNTVIVTGVGAKTDKSLLEFPCRESGSTMRFFMGLAMYFGVASKFYGSETLRKRPFSIYEDLCRDNNIDFIKNEDHIFVNGKLSAGNYEIAGNVSSQFITGLLFMLPLFEKDSKISLIPPVESRSYLNLTIQAMADFGVEVSWMNENELIIHGGQHYKNTGDKAFAVEGDYSNAAFLDAFSLIGGSVDVKGLNEKSLQGDRVYKEYFEALRNSNACLDISDCPDLGPVLFAMAAACEGGVFTGTRRLKMKESDRGEVMCRELAKFGVDSKIEENQIEIFKSELKAPDEVLNGHNDHRIVMSLTLLLTLTGGSLEEAEAVRKSYPGFFEDIKKLGIELCCEQ